MKIVSQVSGRVLPGILWARVNGQGSASISPFKSLTAPSFRLTSRSKDTRRNLDASSELGHLEIAPFCLALLAKLRVCAVVQQRNERKYNPGQVRTRIDNPIAAFAKNNQQPAELVPAVPDDGSA